MNSIAPQRTQIEARNSISPSSTATTRRQRRALLIRIETRAGHGAGKPASKVIEEVTDQWAFLVKNLQMKIP